MSLGRKRDFFMCVFLFCGHVTAISLVIEGEEMVAVHGKVHDRSQASNKKVVHVHKGDMIYFDVCLMASTEVQVEKVVYSNDGLEDRVEVAIDKHALGMVETVVFSGNGAGWNTFHSAGIFLSGGVLPEGRHRLSLTVIEADEHGLEIDFILLKVASNQGASSLKCGAFCFDDISYTDDTAETKMPSVNQGYALQKSTETKCAEEDNINIPVFHEHVSKYTISASLPKYMSFSNNRGADWSHCQMMQSFWTFSNCSFSNPLSVKNGSATLTYYPSTDQHSGDKVGTIDVTFALEGLSTGSTDSEIGTEIYLTGIDYPSNLSLVFQYIDRHYKWSSPETIQVNPSNGTAIFTTPDFAFSEGPDNRIRIDVFSPGYPYGDLKILEIFMFKRRIKDTIATMMYKDASTLVEGVHTDMWWQVNDSMSVTFSDSGRTFPGVHYLRVYHRVPWADSSYSQIFVLYQDGNVRLLPVTPHGLDWIPFGSSVLIGQSDSTHFRPAAPIIHIDFEPQRMELKLFYKDGGVTTLELRATLMETEIRVTDTHYTRDLNVYPFFTFRSMWIADGNGDVDHVTVDGTETHRIMGNWNKMYGNFFAFYRKCISKHNTLSPDIRLKIM